MGFERVNHEVPCLRPLGHPDLLGKKGFQNLTIELVQLYQKSNKACYCIGASLVDRLEVFWPHVFSLLRLLETVRLAQPLRGPANQIQPLVASIS